MAVGERIEQRLKDLEWSQSRLARLTDLPQSTINGIIRRDVHATPHLVKIAAALQTSPAYLSGEADDPDQDAIALPYTAEEIDWMELLRGITPKEREALLTLARSLATSARATVHSPQSDYRAE